VARYAALLALLVSTAYSQTAANVLIVVNQSSNVSKRIGEYYASRRSVPSENLCRIKTTTNELISRAIYENEIEQPIAKYLKSHRLSEKILYIVTTLGVPLKISGGGSSLTADFAAVDSELTLLYGKSKGTEYGITGPVANPFFRKTGEPFRHPQFPIYLVTRLAGYDFADVKALIDKSLAARNRGKFVIDLKAGDEKTGNSWVREAARALPHDRVVLDETANVLKGQREVIGYAAWGSNDRDRKERLLGFQWLPGAIVVEYVSTDGRTFARPPDSWNIGPWSDKTRWFGGAPQTLTADYIHEGASGCAGHVYEPLLMGCPRPQYLFPAYYSGKNLAESYYVSIPGLSWQNIVIGDPLCRIGKPD
jgi:uncharacterized protein (TIGR03790 family)